MTGHGWRIGLIWDVVALIEIDLMFEVDIMSDSNPFGDIFPQGLVFLHTMNSEQLVNILFRDALLLWLFVGFHVDLV